MDATWSGLHLGSRASISSAQTATSNAQLPSIFPSSSQPGSPSMQDCVRSGKPPLTWPLESLIRHSAMHELRVSPPGKSRNPPGSGTTWHCASHPLPGCPFCGPASHSSAHSTLPLPQASTWQLALQPSHEIVLPSSHCSPGSRLPSPQAAVGAGHGGNVGSSYLDRRRCHRPAERGEHGRVAVHDGVGGRWRRQQVSENGGLAARPDEVAEIWRGSPLSSQRSNLAGLVDGHVAARERDLSRSGSRRCRRSPAPRRSSPRRGPRGRWCLRRRHRHRGLRRRGSMRRR